MMKNPIKPAEPAKAYADGQVRQKLSTDKFVAHVASHNSVIPNWGNDYARDFIKKLGAMDRHDA